MTNDTVYVGGTFPLQLHFPLTFLHIPVILGYSLWRVLHLRVDDFTGGKKIIQKRVPLRTCTVTLAGEALEGLQS